MSPLHYYARVGVNVVALAMLVGCNDPQPRTPDARTAAAPTQSSRVADSTRLADAARARQDSINRTLPGYVVDSIFPVEEELRRFRTALGGDSATAFHGGSASKEALVQRFMAAIVRSDTNDLRAMAVHGREFVDLYYPESPYARPPYHQPPSLAWTMIQNTSVNGLTALLRHWGGRPVRYVDHRCDPKVLHEGRTTRYAGCLVRLVDEKGDTTSRLAFGSIVERGGEYKLLSFTNRL